MYVKETDVYNEKIIFNRTFDILLLKYLQTLLFGSSICKASSAIIS